RGGGAARGGGAPGATGLRAASGAGATAMTARATRRKVRDVPLPAHPESFQHDPGSHRIYVNLPDAKAIAVIDPATHKAATWPMQAGGHFPPAPPPPAPQVGAGFRAPPHHGVFAVAGSARNASPPACGDAAAQSPDPFTP